MLPYPQCLRTAGGINQITSPRECGAPSGHHELGRPRHIHNKFGTTQPDFVAHCSYLVHDESVEGDHAEVVDHHDRVEVERLAVGHQARTQVDGEDDVAHQEGRHLGGTVNQRVIFDPGVWKPCVDKFHEQKKLPPDPIAVLPGDIVT